MQQSTTKWSLPLNCLKKCYRQKWHGVSLLKFYAKDFASFLADDFQAIDSDACKNLVYLLHKRCVYVPKGRNIAIATSFYQVIQEDMGWPKIDFERFIGIICCTEKNVLDSRRKNNRAMAHELDITKMLSGLENHTVNFSSPVSSEKSTNCLLKEPNMAKVFKAHSGDDEKYSGFTKDKLERKFMHFLKRYEQADVPDDDWNGEFSIILTGDAWKYYFNVLKQYKLNLKELEMAIKSCFPTPERKRALIRE